MSSTCMVIPMPTPSRTCRLLATVAALTLFSAWTASASAAIPWHPDLATARRASEISQRPVLAIFTASWSSATTTLDRTTLASDEAVALIGACFEPVCVDVDANPEATRRLGITRVPTACIINADERLQGRLKLVFLPNYGVSLAEAIIPAADLSEQISTAGTEASGTGNMKFALNGALTIGTWDGATIEMAEAIGESDVFVFGHRADGIEKLRDLGYLPLQIAQHNPALHAVLDAIGRGVFNPGEPTRYKALIDDLIGYDRYFLLADFADYVAAQQRVDALYAQPERWQAAVARNIAGMGSFSADRTIRDYVTRVWSPASLDSGTQHA